MAEVYNHLFKDTGNQNWFKACITLRIVSNALQRFAVNQLESVHTAIFNSVLQTRGASVGTLCKTCKTQNVLPCPTKDICIGREVCKYHNAPTLQLRQCPANICHSVRERIVSLHRFKNPSWKNSNAQEWFENYWEIAKCFLPPDGYANASSILEVDFNGIISIISNCVEFQQKLSIDLSQPENTITKARDIGRVVRHSPTLSVSDDVLVGIFKTFKVLLSDPVYLANDTRAKEAVVQLQQLEEGVFSIPTEDKLHVTKDGLTLLQDNNEAASDLSEVEAELEDHLRTLETSLKEVERLTKDVFELSLKEMKKIPGEISTTAKYERSKADFKDDLLALYQTGHTTMAVFPLSTNIDDKVEQIFVPQTIYKVPKHEDRDVQSSTRQNRNVVDTFHSLFHTCDRTNNIYVTSAVGMGKTSLCKSIVCAWCKENKYGAESLKDGLSRREGCAIPFSDTSTLKEFAFVFYISLQNAGETFDIDEMIQHQIVEKLSRSSIYDSAFLERLLHTETCLVILDGLDEWTCSGNSSPGHYRLPNKRARTNVTVLTTARYWKLCDPQIRETEIENELEILGFDELSYTCVIKNVANCLSQRYNKDTKDYEAVFSSLRGNNNLLADLISVPIIIMHFLSLLCDGKSIGESKCQMCVNVVEMLLQKAEDCMPWKLARYISEGDTQSTVTLPRWFSYSPYIRKHSSLVRALGHLTFGIHFPNDNDFPIFAFDSRTVCKHLSPTQIEAALAIGILTQRKQTSFSQRESSFSFLKSTFQQLFCAFQLVDEPLLLEGLQLETGSIVLNNSLCQRIGNLAPVHTFISGMDAYASRRISAMIELAIRNSVSDEMGFRNTSSEKMKTVFIAAQECFYQAEREMYANGFNDPYHRSKLACLQTNTPYDLRTHILKTSQHLQMIYAWACTENIDIICSVRNNLTCLMLEFSRRNSLNGLQFSERLTTLCVWEDERKSSDAVDKTIGFDLSHCKHLENLLIRNRERIDKIVVEGTHLKRCCIENIEESTTAVLLIGSLDKVKVLQFVRVRFDISKCSSFSDRDLCIIEIEQCEVTSICPLCNKKLSCACLCTYLSTVSVRNP